MINENAESNKNSSNSFFADANIPFNIKAGMVAILLHTTVNYYKDFEGKETFMANYFDRDEQKRIISGSMNFTFGMPTSIGKGNCLASLKQLEKMYPEIENLLDFESGGKTLSDDEITSKLAVASAKRFEHSAEGSKGNFDKYVSSNFDEYVNKINTYYPGLVTSQVFDSLKKKFELASELKKKSMTQGQPQTQTK